MTNGEVRAMEITIKGSPKEIADLVAVLQSQQTNVVEHHSASKISRKSVYDLTRKFYEEDPKSTANAKRNSIHGIKITIGSCN